MGWVAVVGVVSIALVALGRLSPQQGPGFAIALLPLGIPILPMLWLRSHGEDLTARRAVAVMLWALGSFVPAMVLVVALLGAFGIDGTST